VNQRQRVELARGQFFIHRFRANGRAPRHLERFGLFAAAFRDIEPFVGKCAAHAVEHFFGDQIADGAFHHPPGGGGAQKNQLLGVEKRLQLRLDSRVEVFEPLPAMADHRRTERAERLLADLDRPRNVEFYVPHDFPRSLNR
jgi:hypothetical protein